MIYPQPPPEFYLKPLPHLISPSLQNQVTDRVRESYGCDQQDNEVSSDHCSYPLATENSIFQF